MKQDRFDGYTVTVFQDDEGDYLAHFVELSQISAFADSPGAALSELAIAWEGVKASYTQHIAVIKWMEYINSIKVLAFQSIFRYLHDFPRFFASNSRYSEPIPVVPSRKEYSGQFNVRLDRRLHRALAIEAVISASPGLLPPAGFPAALAAKEIFRDAGKIPI